jgi:hypothetical protein
MKGPGAIGARAFFYRVTENVAAFDVPAAFDTVTRYVPGVVGILANGHGPCGAYEQAGRQTERTLKLTAVPSEEARSGITLGSFGISRGSSRTIAAKVIVLPLVEKPVPRITTAVPTGPEGGESETTVGPPEPTVDPPSVGLTGV